MIQIDLTVLLEVAGLAVLIVLFIAVIRLNEVLKRIKGILERNEKNIDDALSIMPKVLHNTNEITESINEEMKHVKGTIRNIEETVEYAVSTAQTLNDDIIVPVKEVLEILGLLKGIFIKEKKKGWFNK